MSKLKWITIEPGWLQLSGTQYEIVHNETLNKFNLFSGKAPAEVFTCLKNAIAKAERLFKKNNLYIRNSELYCLSK